MHLARTILSTVAALLLVLATIGAAAPRERMLVTEGIVRFYGIYLAAGGHPARQPSPTVSAAEPAIGW